jgi:hypothetical protein
MGRSPMITGIPAGGGRRARVSASTKTKVLLIGAAAAALVTPVALSAGSASASTPTLHIKYNLSVGDYAGALQFAKNGHAYAADSFASALFEVGNPKPLATAPPSNKGGDLSGVAINTDNGDVAYTWTDFRNKTAQLVVLRDGKPIMRSYIRSYEWRHNPDGSFVYGILHPDKHPCAAQTLADNHIPVRNTGGIDSHPYAVAYLGGGSWAVADAGGNDILRVAPNGDVSLIKAIGHQPLKITEAFAEANGLAHCAVGNTYWTESVPTDVEVGPDGLLYVSTLPGGPEDPTAGARGNIYTISQSTHVIHQIGSGFVNPTNLAVMHTGSVYVAEPFAGRVSMLVGGHPSPRMSLFGVTALESANGKLYAATAPALLGDDRDSRIAQLTYGS